MKITFQLSDLSAIIKEYIMPLTGQYRIFTMTGPLGAGKTTFTKELLKQCGVTDIITSPTFGYVNTYASNVPDAPVFYHFDLYRMYTVDDFINAGFDELLYQSNAICLIEWPEIIEPLLASKSINYQVCQLVFSYDDQAHFSSRILEIKK